LAWHVRGASARVSRYKPEKTYNIITLGKKPSSSALCNNVGILQYPLKSITFLQIKLRWGVLTAQKKIASAALH
jgi:hypothetical protein